MTGAVTYRTIVVKVVVDVVDEVIDAHKERLALAIVGLPGAQLAGIIISHLLRKVPHKFLLLF